MEIFIIINTSILILLSDSNIINYCLFFRNQPDGPKAKHVRNKTECLADPRNRWINRKYNFDNLGQASIEG